MECYGACVAAETRAPAPSSPNIFDEIKIFSPAQAREIECQKCRKFPVTVVRQREFKECAPVYNEECDTQYEQHCKVRRAFMRGQHLNVTLISNDCVQVNKKCVHIYQTQCYTSSSYTQTCQQVSDGHNTGHLKSIMISHDSLPCPFHGLCL